MKIRFQVVDVYEVEYDYVGGTETADADFAVAMKDIEGNTDAVVTRAARVSRQVGWAQEA